MLPCRGSIPSTAPPSGRIRVPRNLKEENQYSNVNLGHFESNFQSSKKIPKKFNFCSKNSKSGSKRTKLALNPDAIEIREFLSNFESIWAILGPMESLESLKNFKKSNFGSKNSKLAQKSIKLALNSDAIEIRGFLSNFGAIWAILGPMESLESLESLKNSKKNQLWVKKFKTGSERTKLALNSDSIVIRGFLSNFGVIWAILGPMVSFEGLQSSLRSDKAKNALKRRQLEKT